MNLEEIKKFLQNRPGYLKEGHKRLRDTLRSRGFESTLKDCKIALQESRRAYRVRPIDNTINNPKILIYDIETSYGLARVWRPSYRTRVSYDSFINHGKIICISYKWLGEDEVHSLSWDSNQCDKKLLEEFIKVLNEADFSVAHNGDNFDLKTVKTRGIFHNLSLYPSYTTVDTLKIARSYFKFPSNRLDDIGDYLGIGRKINVGIDLWDKVILEKCKASLLEMIDYCEQDVLLLEGIYIKLSEYMLPTIHAGVQLNNKTKQSSPYNGGSDIELVKTTTTKAGTKKHLMIDNSNGKYFKMSNTDYRKFLEIYK